GAHDLAVVDLDDQVAGAEADLRHGTEKNNDEDRHNPRGVGPADPHGDLDPADPAEPDQVVGDPPRPARENGEADPLIAAAQRLDRGVDADDPALEVDERAAGVARVDGGVGLDQVLVGRQAETAPLAADDPRGHRARQAE